MVRPGQVPLENIPAIFGYDFASINPNLETSEYITQCNPYNQMFMSKVSEMR